MRIIFMGTPEFAIPSLQVLYESHTLLGVVTQPDRPAGRNRRVIPSPVKVHADEIGVEILQPRKVREILDRIQELSPDLIVVAAFGQILPASLLEIPTYGSLNVHASLLPRWRGAAPIQASIFHGDKDTGITLMAMDEGLDTGPILAQQSIPILEEDTTGTLSTKLAQLGAEMLHETLPKLEAGEVTPIPQDGSLATYALQLRKVDGLLDFTRSAERLARQVRAYTPWPGSYFSIDGIRLNVLQAAFDPKTPGKPGELVEIRGSLGIGSSQGVLILERVQPAGKKPMPSKAYLAGHRKILGRIADRA
jgi:methionyl-tRNA formyltransferase